MIFDLQLFAGDSLLINVTNSDGVITLGQPAASGGVTTTLDVNTVVSVGIANTALSAVGASPAFMLGGTSHVMGTNTSVFFASTVSIMDQLNTNVLNIASTSVAEVDFLGNAGTVQLTKTAEALNFGGSGTAKKRRLEIASAGQMVLTSTGTATSVNGLAVGGAITVGNSKYNAEILKSDMSGISILGTKNSNLTFNADVGNLNLGAGTDSVVINMKGTNTGLSVGFVGVESANFTNVSGNITMHSLASSSRATLNGVHNFTLTLGDNVDSTSGLLINTSAHTQNLILGGRGVTTLAGSGAALTDNANYTSVSGWATSSGVDTVAADVVNIGGGDFASLSSSFGSTLTVQYASGMQVHINTIGDGSASTSDKAIGIRFANSGNEVKDILFTSGSAMSANDDTYTISEFDVLVANGDENRGVLDLGDRTDQTAILLHGDGKTEHFGTKTQYVGYNSVISSSATNSILISDLANQETLLYGAGERDSIFSALGGTASSGMRDTIGSAAGKSALLATSDYSGIDYVLNDSQVAGLSNADTTFDFAKFDSATGEYTSGDVILLFNGAGHMKYNRGNFEVGANDDNYLSIEGVATGQQDVAYTGSFGGNVHIARVDMTRSKGSLEYDNAIAFYVGNDSDTRIVFDKNDTGEKLNYAGGAVMTGVTDIDASSAGADNIIFGTNNYKQTITASTTGATSICGGVAGETDYTDGSSDTLVGGLNTTFFVGQDMGSDRITNVQNGDTIVFLGTKYMDNTKLINDNVGTSLSFDDTTIRFDAATNMAAVNDLTVKFDDYTWKWDGANWTYTETQK